MIETLRTVLRVWRSDDLEPFARLNADPRVMEFFPKRLTREESDQLAQRIQTHFDERGFGLWAMEIPGVTPFAGFVGLSIPRFESHFTPCVEIGWRMAYEFWGRGYATEAAVAVLRFAFLQLGLAEVVSFTAEPNERSWRMMERIGMERDRTGDFEHPVLPKGDPLSWHRLYRAKADNWPIVAIANAATGHSCTTGIDTAKSH